MKQAKIIATKLLFAGVDITADEIIELIESRATEFQISEEMATLLIEKELIEHYKLDLNTHEDVVDVDISYEYIDDLDKPDEFVRVVAVVTDLWETYDDEIQQMGILGDEKGEIKFTVCDVADQPLLKKGTVYHFWKAIVKEHNGELELRLTAQSEIERLTDNGTYDISQYVDGDQEAVPFTGVITRIEPGSGLIERCSVGGCAHVLKNGHCSEHGKVNGEDDLRVKAVIDNGTEHRRVTITVEAAETLLGFSTQDAISNPDIDLDQEIHNQFVGQYADCSLVECEGNSYVRSIELNTDQSAEYIHQIYDLADELKYTL